MSAALSHGRPRDHPHGHPPGPPPSGRPVEHAGDRGAARPAAPVLGQPVAPEAVPPVPLDDDGPATGAAGTPPGWVVDVAGVDEAQPVAEGNAAGTPGPCSSAIQRVLASSSASESFRPRG